MIGSNPTLATHQNSAQNQPIPLVETRNLTKTFASGISIFGRNKSVVRAVDGIDLSIYEGETFSLVGETGCGKSTLGRLLVRLIEPTSGSVTFEGKDLSNLNREKMRLQRASMQMIFQDPYGSLDPRFTVRQSIAEPLKAHGMKNKIQLKDRVAELIEMVGLPKNMSERLPSQMSGGQRQRVGIARAIALEPKFIVADEPVSALDVSVQAQILNLMMELQQRLGLTYLFVAHGLNVVRHVSNRVGVMYLGRIVELGSVEALFESYAHPYTASLLSAVLTLGSEKTNKKIQVRGEVGSASNLPTGCRFNPRCPARTELCEREQPELTQISEGHWVACHFPTLSKSDRDNLAEKSTQITTINFRR